MSWNYENVQLLLRNKSFVIRRIFKCKSYILLEVFSTRFAESLLLKIQTQFSLPSDLVYYCEKTSVDERQSTLSDTFIEKAYSDVQNSVLLPDTPLEDIYRQKVTTQNVQSESIRAKLDIRNQLGRIQYSVKGLPYTLALLHYGFLGVLEEERKIKLYECIRVPKSQERSLYLVVELPAFVDKLEVVEQESMDILQSMYSILGNNQQAHSRSMKRMMERNESILDDTQRVHTLQEKYAEYVAEYMPLLEEICLYESQKQSQVRSLREQTLESVQHEMKRDNDVRKLEKELADLANTKKEILRMLEELKTKQQTLLLNMDSILFDNNVMLHKILANCDTLKEYASHAQN